MYQGHLPAGNPVQRHSAGDHYPYVIEVWERPQASISRYYGVIGPGIKANYFAREDEAEAFALASAAKFYARA